LLILKQNDSAIFLLATLKNSRCLWYEC